MWMRRRIAASFNARYTPLERPLYRSGRTLERIDSRRTLMSKVGVLVTAIVAGVTAAVGLSAATAASSAPPKRTVIKVAGPGHLGVGFGSVWVEEHRLDSVRRIDPKTDRLRTIAIGESVCAPPAFGAGAVWVWGCDSNRIYEINATNNRVVAKVDGTNPVFGAGSLWLLSTEGKIVRVDPTSRVVLATIDPKIDAGAGGPDIVAVGSVWVSGDSAVSRIDVNTNQVTAVIPLPGWKPSGGVSGGYLDANFGTFANNRFFDSNAAGVYAIDPATNTAKHLSIAYHALSQAGDFPIIAGNGSVWVRTSDSSVARIDPASGNVIARYPAEAAGGGGGIAIGFGSLWVANFGTGTIWRTPIR
jgi:streptogramin lyase